MKILSKKIMVYKSHDTVYQIIKSSAYKIPVGNGDKKALLIYCAKRFKGGIVSLIPVKISMEQQKDHIEVILSLHSHFGFYAGCFLCLMGIIGLCWCVISTSSRWIPCVGSILLGMLVGGQSIWEGIGCLDMLKRKLEN